MLRKLDGCYFRAERDGKWSSICFTDLESQEAENVIQNCTDEWLESLLDHLWGDLDDIYRVVGYVPKSFASTVEDIKTFNSTRIKILLLRSLIRIMANEYDIVGGEQ